MNQAEVKRRQAQAISTILALITLAVVARLTGYNGVTYVAAALEVYTFLYVIISAGIVDALGRVLRLRKTKGQYRNAERMRRNAMLFQMALGAAGAAIALIGGERIAEKMFKVQYSSLILMLLAPVVFLRSVSQVLLGYSRGERAELPAAAAGILRQLFILGFSVLFCKITSNYGYKVSRLLVQENYTSMFGGVGVSIAVTLSEVFVIIFLLLIYRKSRRPENRAVQEGMRVTDSFMDSIRILCVNRGAQVGILLLAILSIPVGLISFQKAGDSSGKAAEYGVYLAGYCVVWGFCAALVMLALIPICGKTVSLLRKDEQRFARTVFQGGVHAGVVCSAFFVVFVTVMAPQMAAVVCPEQAELGAKMLRGGSLVILSVALCLYFARLLILTGRKYLVLAAVAVADVIDILAVAVLLNVGKVGILALVYGGMAGSGVLCIILGMLAYRQFRQRMDWMQTLVVPLAVACVTGLLGMLLGKVFTPHLGNLITLIVCLVFMEVLYWAGLLLLRNFREQELEIMPGGKLLNAMGQMLRVL